MKILKKCIKLTCIIFLPLLIDGIAMVLFDAQPIRDFILRLLVGDSFFTWIPFIGYKIDGLFSIALFIFLCSLSCSKSETILTPSLNLDSISLEDKEWIEEIRYRHKRGDKIIAYSSNGALAAKRKARKLGIEACFIDFISIEERDRIRECKA